MIHFLIWGMSAAMYMPAFIALYSGKTNWALEDYSHIYFILPISLFLAWRKRDVLRKIRLEDKAKRTGTFSGLALLISGILLFIFGWRRNYDFIQILSLVPFLSGLIRYLYGKMVLKELSFPVAYLLFLVPLPPAILDGITVPMRYGVSFAAEKFLAFAGYPVTRDGLLLSIGYREIYMAPACSGFRSLITMLTLSLVYIYLISAGRLKKSILTFAVIPLALLGNFVRIIAICLITFYFGEEAGQGFFHNFSGVAVFLITILGLIALENLMSGFMPEGVSVKESKDE